MSKRRAAPSGGASGFGGFGAGSGFGASGLLSSSSSPLSIVREPLDTTGISNPSVVVQFKNFSKQSEITKQKALDELQAQVAELEKSGTPLEDAFISAWVGNLCQTQIYMLTGQGVFISSTIRRLVSHCPNIRPHASGINM